MAKTKIEFVCKECGASHYQWAGQCLECKAWNTLEEVVLSQTTASKPESLKDLPPSKVQNLSAIKSENRAVLFEIYQGYLKISEDLDLNNERLRVADDEITKYNHERLNNNMYRLSILSAVFLPLGFLTGLLGVNIAGVPGVSSPSAFIVFCALLLVIFGLQLLILKRLKWF